MLTMGMVYISTLIHYATEMGLQMDCTIKISYKMFYKFDSGCKCNKIKCVLLCIFMYNFLNFIFNEF